MRISIKFLTKNLLISVAIIGMTPIAPVDAAIPKAGTTCSKLGQTIIYQGKRFTCIKSGTKRIWDKGVLIKATPTPTPSTSSSTLLSPTPTSTLREFTLAQISAHNTATSCWSAINGDVYDLTTWIGQHPGGAGAIQRICGIDGTSAFNNQHEGSGKVAKQLSQFYIGRLKL